MKRLLIATAFLFITFLYITPESHAQSYDWTCDFNFLTGQQGWDYYIGIPASQYAQYVLGSGWRMYSAKSNYLAIVSPAFSGTVASITEYFSGSVSLTSGGFSSFIRSTRTNGISTIALPKQYPSTLSTFTYAFTPYTLSNESVMMNQYLGTTGSFSTSFYLQRAIISGNGTKPSLSQCSYTTPPQPVLTAPLLSTDIEEIGSNVSNDYVYWLSNSTLDPVHAMIGGTVERVTEKAVPQGSYTEIEISNGSQYRVIQYINTSTTFGSPSNVGTTLGIPMVKVGDNINASCILGYTFARTVAGVYGLRNRTESQLLLNGSPVAYTGSYSAASASPYCGASNTETEQCLGDATFRSGEWNLSGNATITETGVLLGSGASISTTMSLSATKWTELRAVFNPERSGIIQLTLGTEVKEFRVPAETALITEALHTADVGTFYTVKAKNTGSGNLYLSYLCVRITKDDAGNPIAPSTLAPIPSCKLTNSNFLAGLTSWSKSNTFNTVTYSNLQAHIPFGEYIYQNVTLTPGTYTLTAIVSLDYTTATIPFSTDSVSVLYSFPSLTPTSTLGSFFVSTMVASNYKVLTTTFNVSTATTGNFYLFAQSATTAGTGVGVSSICITGDKIKSTSCYPLPDPTGTGVGEWTNWLWLKLNNFFGCELMPTLNDINNIITRQFLMLGWGIKYQMASADNTATWMGTQLLPWLAGYMSNIQPGNVTVESSCNNIFCVILGGIDVIGKVVDIFGKLLNLAGAIIQKLFEIGGAFVSQISALFNNANYLFNAIANAYVNATPVSIPIIPTCTANPRSSGFCIVSWMLQNTILSGTGAYFIPLLISFGSILWIIWAVKEIKKAVIESGANL